MMTTISQAAAIERLLLMGELFFSGTQVSALVKLKLNPLLCGPTGVGKTHLVQEVASRLKAKYFRVTRSDWLVVGCRQGRPSVYQIMDTVLSHDRTLVHLDEFDKIQIDFKTAGEWSASVAQDYMSVLEGKFQIDEYLATTQFEEAQKPSAYLIQEKLRRSLWLVGSGTWQQVYVANRPGSTIGFTGPAPARPVAVDQESIARAQLISPELLYRFNSDLILLTYPSLTETAALLRLTGLTALARQLGLPLDPAEVHWEHGGMRALETVATRLALEKLRREKPTPVTLSTLASAQSRSEPIPATAATSTSGA